MADRRTFSDLFSLQGKVAIITGGGSGMGAAMVRLFVEAGARVIAADVNLEGAVAVVEALPDRSRALAVKVDIADEASVKQMAERSVSKFGAPDILVNNAGSFPIWPLAETTVERWDHAQAINLRGAFLCCREVIPRIPSYGGSIVNISSLGSLKPYPGLSAYCAAKAGVVGLTYSLAVEVASKHIRVNAILPGGTVTEGVRKNFPNPGEAEAACAHRVPLGRCGVPEDIAAAALFLASEAAAFMTGAALPVDGGYLLS